MLLLTVIISALIVSLFPAGETVSDAEALLLDGKYEKAAKTVSDALDRAVSDSDTTEMIKALCIQAEMALDMGMDEKAVDCYNRCLDLSGFGEPMFMLSSSLYNIANIYYQNGEYDQAEKYISRSISMDSVRSSDSVLALKYLLAAMIMYDKGDYVKSVELSETGRRMAAGRLNYNLIGRLIFIETLCREKLCGDAPDWADIERGYRESLDNLEKTLSGFHYGTVNPYRGEVLYHLGLAVSAQGKDGKPYLEEALRNSRMFQKMRGVNPMVEYESCIALSRILEDEGDREGAAEYKSRTDSLSFIPYLKKLSTDLSLSQMEFIRREKDMEIELRKKENLRIIIATSVLVCVLIVILLMYRRLFRQKRAIEEKNGQLVKLVLQKDRLMKMVDESTASPVETKGFEKIVSDAVPLPQIKLSKRELQVLDLCCKGMISKEIADALHISTRTVDNHKSNIFRKLGINTTAELIAFSYKSGLVGRRESVRTPRRPSGDLTGR